MFKKIKRYLKDPYWGLGSYLIKCHPNWMSDKFYICTLWRMVMGYKLNLKNPQTFNEKLQWLKLYDRNPLYTILVDKLRVKDWVADKIGSQYVIPTLAIYNTVDEIDLDKLPNQFVLKCNHDSGSFIICKDKSTFNLHDAKIKLREALKHNFYYEAREWPYKNVKPCIFAEVYMEDTMIKDLPDYKFFTFDGVAKALFLATERNSHKTETRFDFFDIQFKHIDVTNGHPNADILPNKPACFDEMIELSEKLSKDIPHVRLDFYEVNGKAYFGEFTFYHFGGMTPFKPDSFDKYLGDFLRIPNTGKKGGYSQVFVKDNQVVHIHAEDNFNGLKDYKFFCFNGEPKLMYIANDKSEHPTTDFFDMEFNRVNLRMKDPNSIILPQKPVNFELMKKMCAILSKNIPMVRLDFYEVDGHLYFGEFTFYHSGGFVSVTPQEWNKKIGDWIKI